MQSLLLREQNFLAKMDVSNQTQEDENIAFPAAVCRKSIAGAEELFSTAVGIRLDSSTSQRVIGIGIADHWASGISSVPVGITATKVLWSSSTHMGYLSVGGGAMDVGRELCTQPFMPAR